jgi:hypothetical protein
MRRMFAPAMASLFFMFLFMTDSNAQRRTDPPEIEVEPTANNCPTTIADCPVEGCGTDADFKLNSAKNRTDAPSSSTIQVMTLDQLRAIPQPSSWPVNKDRSSLQGPGREGTPVVLKGFLLRAKKEGAESCNCGVLGVKNTDIHLVLVDDPNDIEATSVTAEMTPRVRRNGHGDWIQSQVKQFEGEYVRVIGWIMLDTKHIRRPLVRSTNWEVHPITKFEHCTKSKAACDADQGWEEF